MTVADVVQLSGPYDHRIRAFRCGTTVDTFAVITERFVVVVDTMVNPESMQVAMDYLDSDLTAFSGRQLLVVNTHGDWDHVWGNGLFVGPGARYPAPVIGQRRTVDRMRSVESAELLASFQAEHPGHYDSAAFWPPTLAFEGAFCIDGGDLTLQLISTPGHTADHTSVWIPEIRALFAGDAAERPLPFVDTPHDVPILRASLRLLADLQAETVLCCHAPGVYDASIIRANIAYFDELERRCRTALSSGLVAPSDRPDDAAVYGTIWPFDAAVPAGWRPSGTEEEEFYGRAHRQAVRAMLGWIDLETR